MLTAASPRRQPPPLAPAACSLTGFLPTSHATSSNSTLESPVPTHARLPTSCLPLKRRTAFVSCHFAPIAVAAGCFQVFSTSPHATDPFPHAHSRCALICVSPSAVARAVLLVFSFSLPRPTPLAFAHAHARTHMLAGQHHTFAVSGHRPKAAWCNCAGMPYFFFVPTGLRRLWLCLVRVR